MIGHSHPVRPIGPKLACDQVNGQVFGNLAFAVYATPSADLVEDVLEKRHVFRLEDADIGSVAWCRR